MVDSGNLSASWHCPNSWGNTEKRWLEMLHQNLPTNESKLLKESYHCWQILLYYENPALVGKQMNSLICKWKQCVPCQDRRADRADAQEHTHISNASAWVVESSFPFFSHIVASLYGSYGFWQIYACSHRENILWPKLRLESCRQQGILVCAVASAPLIKGLVFLNTDMNSDWSDVCMLLGSI